MGQKFPPKRPCCCRMRVSTSNPRRYRRSVRELWWVEWVKGRGSGLLQQWIPSRSQMDALGRMWLFMTFHELKINYYWITKIYRSEKVLTTQFQRFILSSQAAVCWWVHLGLPSFWKENHRPHNNCNDLLTVKQDRLEFPSYQYFVFWKWHFWQISFDFYDLPWKEMWRQAVVDQSPTQAIVQPFGAGIIFF